MSYTNVLIQATSDCTKCGTADKSIRGDGYAGVCPFCKGTKRMHITLRFSDLQALIADGYVPSGGS